MTIASKAKHPKSPEVPVRNSADAAAYIQNEATHKSSETTTPTRQLATSNDRNESSINNSPRGNSAQVLGAVSVENAHSSEI